MLGKYTEMGACVPFFLIMPCKNIWFKHVRGFIACAGFILITAEPRLWSRLLLMKYTAF